MRAPTRAPTSGGPEREPLRRPLLLSAAGHGCLLATSLLWTIVGHKPFVWGEGSGGAATVRLVSAASIPLPPPSVPTQNRVATETPGLHRPEPPEPKATPPPKPPEPEEAVELPARDAKAAPKPEPGKKEEVAKKPAPAKPPEPKKRVVAEMKSSPQQQPARRRIAEPLPRASNEIPYGEGGPAQGPYGMFQTEGGSGGFGFSEGAGEFGARFSWYVTAIRNRISSNWLKGTVDPNVRSAPRVYASFQILRDGRIVNTQLTSSSGVPSLDRSALRAIYDSSPMPPLPADYTASSVTVEFWFDFRR